MLQLVVNAIRARNVLSFHYDGLHRVVEPHAVGESTRGNTVLRCFQVDGLSNTPPIPDWRLMSLDKIQALEVLPKTFAGVRPGYVRGDRGMTFIHAEL